MAGDPGLWDIENVRIPKNSDPRVVIPMLRQFLKEKAITANLDLHAVVGNILPQRIHSHHLHWLCLDGLTVTSLDVDFDQAADKEILRLMNEWVDSNPVSKELVLLTGDGGFAPHIMSAAQRSGIRFTIIANMHSVSQSLLHLPDEMSRLGLPRPEVFSFYAILQDMNMKRQLGLSRLDPVPYFGFWAAGCNGGGKFNNNRYWAWIGDRDGGRRARIPGLHGEPPAHPPPPPPPPGGPTGGAPGHGPPPAGGRGNRPGNRAPRGRPSGRSYGRGGYRPPRGYRGRPSARNSVLSVEHTPAFTVTSGDKSQGGTHVLYDPTQSDPATAHKPELPMTGPGRGFGLLTQYLPLKNTIRYEQFEREGELVEGEDLGQAYDSISAFSSRRNNQEAVFGAEESIKEERDATLADKAEALELQRQLRRLQTQYDVLTGQSSALIQGRRARVAATSAVTGQITAIEDSLSGRNLQMNGDLGRLASTSQELAHYHSGEEDGIYLAHSDFHACTKELNQWFAKQLDTGSYRFVAEEGKSKCSWVSLDDTSNMLRDLENSQHQRVSELQRLGIVKESAALVA